MEPFSKARPRRLKSQVTVKLCGPINQLTKAKSKEDYHTVKVRKLGAKQMKRNWINTSSIRVHGKTVRWKASASCTCHRMKFILVSSCRVTLVDTVLESGWMEMSTKAASKMVINKVMAPSCVRRGVGHSVVTGSKAKWMAKALVSGKIAPSIKVSGAIALRRVLVHWVTLMAPSIKVTSVTITPTDKERKLLLMAQFI